MGAPLQDITVLDVGTLTPGKYCTFLLADMGARVLRIERPPADPRSISDEDLVLNRNKRSISEMNVEKIDRIQPLTDDEFVGLFGSALHMTGDLTTNEFIDQLRGNA